MRGPTTYRVCARFPGQLWGSIMAKQAQKTGTSRIRFVMFDAEIADGEIGPITQAIQNALKGPAQPQVVRLPAHKPAELSGEAQEVESLEPEDAVEEAAEARPARPAAPRKPAPTPNVVELDMDSPMSLTDFAQGKDAKSNHKRFLIAAAWLKEHRNVDAVTADHIYTCYRKMGWPTNIADFAQPLRELKTRKFFTTPERGMYAINHIGLDAVKKAGGA